MALICLDIETETILDVMPECIEIGRRESNRFIWFNLEDVDSDIIGLKIPLKRLDFIRKVINFNLDWIKDLSLSYQPFIKLTLLPHGLIVGCDGNYI